MADWLGSVGGVPLERIGGVRRSLQSVSTSAPPKAVLHTTEGGWDSSLAVFARTGTPTFMVGRDSGRLRVAQFMPIGEMALSLENPAGGVETNRLARVQIELVAFSQRAPWLPDAETTRVLAALMGAIRVHAGVPLRRGGDGTRSVTRWLREDGWFGHSEVPENDHWDPGAIRWAELFRLAGGAVTKEDDKVWTPERFEKVKAWARWLLAEKGDPARKPAILDDFVPTDLEWEFADGFLHPLIRDYPGHALYQGWRDHRTLGAERPAGMPDRISRRTWDTIAADLEWAERMDDQLEQARADEAAIRQHLEAALALIDPAA